MSSVQPPSLKVDIDQLRDITRIGARRTAAFIAIGSTRDDARLNLDFSLGSRNHRFRYWPDGLPLEIIEKAVSEFDSWILGVCLQDLHLHFELFLNGIWELARVVSEHGVRVPSSYVLHDPQYRRQTSVSDKYSRVAELLSVVADRTEFFRSFHAVRNCLTHNAGYVRESDCTDSKRFLQVSWIGQSVLLRDGEAEIEMQDAIDQQYKTQNETSVLLTFPVRQLCFSVNEKISFEHRNIAEISWFYVSSADLLVDALAKLIKEAQLA